MTRRTHDSIIPRRMSAETFGSRVITRLQRAGADVQVPGLHVRIRALYNRPNITPREAAKLLLIDQGFEGPDLEAALRKAQDPGTVGQRAYQDRRRREQGTTLVVGLLLGWAAIVASCGCASSPDAEPRPRWTYQEDSDGGLLYGPVGGPYRYVPRQDRLVYPPEGARR